MSLPCSAGLLSSFECVKASASAGGKLKTPWPKKMYCKKPCTHAEKAALKGYREDERIQAVRVDA